MRKAIVSIAALATLGAAPPSEPGAGQDTLTDEQTVELERERYHRVTVPVSLQGEGPYRFLVDTGAEATVVSDELATTLALPSAGRTLIVGMASTAEAPLVDVENLTLGSMDFCCLTAPVLQKQQIGADGILGLDSLQDSRVLIDFERDSMIVQDARDQLGSGGFEVIIRAKERRGQLIIARARVDGVATSIIIDTGSQISIANPALGKALRKRTSGEAEWRDVLGNTQSGNIRMARQIEIGRIALGNIPIAVADAPPFEFLGLTKRPAMIIGMKQLRLFRRVAIDFPSRRILFDLPPDVRPTSNLFGSVAGG